MTITELGYLENPYLDPYPYMSGQIDDGRQMQVEMVIKDHKTIAMQAEMQAHAKNASGMQIDAKTDGLNFLGMQAEMQVSPLERSPMQVRVSSLGLYWCEKYLNNFPYLDDAYLTDCINAHQKMQAEMLTRKDQPFGMQADMRIFDSLATGYQAEMRIFDSSATGMQAEMQAHRSHATAMQVDMKTVTRIATGMQAEGRIFTAKNNGMQAEMRVFKETPSGFQVKNKIISPDDDVSTGMQVKNKIVKASDDKYQHMQVELRIFIDKKTGMQTDARIFAQPATAMQTEMRIFTEKNTGMEVRIYPLGHYWCEKYLNNYPYLDDPYLSDCINAHQKMQAEGRIFIEPKTGMQTEMRIFKEKNTGMQSEMRVFIEPPTHMQVQRVRAAFTPMQAAMIIYNITQLRILGPDFASRGTPALGGLNWTSMQPLKPGHYSANNLNTDILEERTQTDAITALWELRCDTGIPQGAFVDSVAILEHNFTKSARVTFQGTNDLTWGSVGINIVMVTELKNMYYIAPTLPNQSYRYWRFIIEDFTNPDTDGLKIGAIVFGRSNIFTKRENFENPVRWGKNHYKDTTEVEGYSTVSNDRGIRKTLGLDFAEIKYDGGNYKLLHEFYDTAKTDLKCLIIPRPTRPSSLAVFAKLNQLPDEQHQAISDDNHYVTFSLDWDESQ